MQLSKLAPKGTEKVARSNVASRVIGLSLASDLISILFRFLRGALTKARSLSPWHGEFASPQSAKDSLPLLARKLLPSIAF